MAASGLMLRIDALSKSFAGVQALSGVTFEVPAGTISALIGPNGAGKTTLFNIVTGALAATSGSVRLGAMALDGLAPHLVARQGIARTFQQAQLYRTLTALENVMLGCHARGASGLLACGLGLTRAAAEDRRDAVWARECLARVGLSGREEQVACELPLGEQRLLEIARSLATRPRLLLLDEPAAGLNDSETRTLGDLLIALRGEGLTLFVIEHHMRFVMRVSDRVVVLNFGQKIADGTPTEVRADAAVIAAYLGAEEVDA